MNKQPCPGNPTFCQLTMSGQLLIWSIKNLAQASAPVCYATNLLQQPFENAETTEVPVMIEQWIGTISQPVLPPVQVNSMLGLVLLDDKISLIQCIRCLQQEQRSAAADKLLQLIPLQGVELASAQATLLARVLQRIPWYAASSQRWQRHAAAYRHSIP